MALLVDAAVGAVFGELLKAVLEVKDKAIMFKQTLVYLQSTLVAIAPVIKEIDQHNIELGRPNNELESLLKQMEDGTKLVCKCSQIHRLNYVARARYQEKLEALVNSLVRFFTLDMQAYTARDQKETLLCVRRMVDTARDNNEILLRIRSALNKLFIPGSSSRSNPVPESEIDESEYEDARSFISDIGASNRSLFADSDPVPESDTPISAHNASRTSSLQIVRAHNKRSLSVLLLHGYLDIWVHGAENLPNMEMVSLKIPIDPYVTISVSNAVIGRTFVISKCENPVWEQHFYVPVAHHAAEVHFRVKDSDVVGSELIGIVAIPVEQICSGEKVQGTYPVLKSNGKPCKPGAVLMVSIQYIPMEKLIFYHQGVGSGPDYIGVPGTYFPLRKGGTVTLYQDAHVPDGCLPNVMLDNGMYYAHGKCWFDIVDAISQAQHLIYITAWSLWHKVRLVRDAGYASYFTLGDLLRSKSQEGVRVLLLVWDDPTSTSILGFKTDGIMGTHDEETREYFKNSSVCVLLCPRIAGKQHSWAKQKEVGTTYTHHQKTVIVDADAGSNKRKIVAFVGGLDLSDRQYDTPQHSLFRTLQTLHKDDYHNPNFMGNTDGCPREPWHDLHSKIDGPAAYDVLTNFEERWLRAANYKGSKKWKSSYNDALLKLDRIREIISAPNAPGVGDDNPEAWHVQILLKDFQKSQKMHRART